jgi:hypothetical protein
LIYSRIKGIIKGIIKYLFVAQEGGGHLLSLTASQTGGFFIRTLIVLPGASQFLPRNGNS